MGRHRTARVHRPLYVVNGEEAFFGFYPVAKHTVSIKGEPNAVYDLMGADTTLFHHAVTDDKAPPPRSTSKEARRWFDSMCTTVSREPAA